MQKSYFAARAAVPKIIAAVVSILLVGVNMARIINVPITFDENGYTGTEKYDTYSGLALDQFGSANNHILHSLLRKFFVDTFGNSLFTLRLDDLLAQLFFLLFGWLLCRRLFRNNWWTLGAFLLLNFASPLIFQFWGLSRGYALALSFMTASLYCLFGYMADGRRGALYGAFICAILAVYSNFGYINYFLVLCGVVVADHLLFLKSRPNNDFVKDLCTILVACCILALMIAGPLSAVYHNGELMYLGSDSFIKNTVRTVVFAGLNIRAGSEGWLVYFISRLVVIFTGMSACFWIYVYVRKWRSKASFDAATRNGIILFLLLISPAISLIAQHVLVGINYLTDRTALFFIILFVLHAAYLFYYIAHTWLVPGIISFAALLLPATVNFCADINLHTTILWNFNSADLAILRKINNESAQKPGKIKVGISWLSEPTMRYNMLHYYPGRFYPLQMIKDTPPGDSSCDYFYLNTDDVPRLPRGYYRDTAAIGGTFILFKRAGR